MSAPGDTRVGERGRCTTCGEWGTIPDDRDMTRSAPCSREGCEGWLRREYEPFVPEGDGPITPEQALDGINRIRNSIVGAQSLNWSEHIYPLVALLNRAGYVGEDYPEARRNVGTLIEFRDEALVLLRAARGEGITHELHDRIVAFLDRTDTPVSSEGEAS